MDIDGYDGSQLASLNNEQIDNSLNANVNQMFDNTSVERIDNSNNMGNELEDNSTEQHYIENMDTNDDERVQEIENMNNQKEDVIKSATQNPNQDVANKSFIKSIGFIVIFVVIWAILGIIAFITSIVCFGYSGSMTEKVIGLLLALLFGPFYFLYFYFNKGYCGKKTTNVKSE